MHTAIVGPILAESRQNFDVRNVVEIAGRVGAISAVEEGEDLQARLDAAADGDALCLAPGRYPGTVVVRHAVTLWGPEGEFVGPGCRGLICAEFRHPSLLPREPWVFEPNRGEEVVTARPLERITGTVVDPEGQPVAGARLMVRRGSDDDPTALPPFTANSTVSDADGVFNFARVERPPCDPCGEASGRCEVGDAAEVPAYNALVLVARGAGFRGVERAVELGQDDWQIMLLPPLPPLTGTVKDAEGRSYPRARVLARSHARGYEVHQAVVKDGAFTFEIGRASCRERVSSPV